MTMDLLLCFLVLFSAVAQTAHGQDPTVTIVETAPVTNAKGVITATRDEDVLMDCYVENLPPGTNVKWRRKYKTASGNEQLQDISTNEGATDNTKHGVEKPTEFTWRLRIKSIKVADEGTYECFVTVILQSVTKDQRIIRVMIPPTLDPAQTSTDTTVREGDNVELLCNATGRPTPMIEWTRQGGAMLPAGTEMHRGSKLEIPNVRYQFRGVYYCDVYNEIGADRRSIRLNVRFKPQIVILDRVIYQAVGYQVELQCFVDSNPYPNKEDIRWTKDALSYSTDSGRFKVKAVRGAFNRMTFELIIERVQPSDYGVYSCRVSNNEGTSYKNIELRESETPVKSVKLGRIIRGSATSVYASLQTIAFLTTFTAMWLL